MTGNLPEKQVQEMLKQIPLQRLGRAEEVAAVVKFLASDGGAYITGETVHVNGGMYLGLRRADCGTIPNTPREGIF